MTAKRWEPAWVGYYGTPGACVLVGGRYLFEGEPAVCTSASVSCEIPEATFVIGEGARTRLRTVDMGEMATRAVASWADSGPKELGDA